MPLDVMDKGHDSEARMQGGNEPSQPLRKGIRADAVINTGKFGDFVFADDLAVFELKLLRQSLQFLDFLKPIHIPPLRY